MSWSGPYPPRRSPQQISESLNLSKKMIGCRCWLARLFFPIPFMEWFRLPFSMLGEALSFPELT